MKKSYKLFKPRTVFLLCLPLLLAWPVEAAHVILTDGRRMEGSAIRARANGDVILTTPRGDLTFTRGQYTEAWAPRPREIEQARQQLQAGNHEQVISTLEGVVSQFRNLGWDNEALILIGRAQTNLGQYSSAMSSFQRLFQNAPNRREDSNVRWAFYRSMLGSGELDRLERNLNELISDGERVDAARAQVMRGDIKMQRGLAEAAVLDYLRTVVLFSAQREVQAEALYKAGVALESMRDDRANQMFRKVINEYGQSSFARQARERLGS